MEKGNKRGNFTGSIGFVLAAAGSAVGLGNIWRFPYLAAKDGGGTFILVYIILALTFGFTLLTTDVAIGRKTGQSPLNAYRMIHPKWGGLGILACIIPVVILPYYCSIGGWVLKYLGTFITGHGVEAAQDGYFTGYITSVWQPIIWLFIYLFLTAFVVYRGVNKGIENYSRILMPILLVMIVGISIFSMTLSHSDADGVTRSGLQGLKVYLVPNFSGMTLKDFVIVFVDALGQLFFSISVAMGIMVTYGSYVKKETNLMRSINQIEWFDTAVALLAGLMIVPAVYTFMGTEGMSAGPGLMFVSLPKVFYSMGTVGRVIGILFFVLAGFAALTSCISVLESITANCMELFHTERKKTTRVLSVIYLIATAVIALGYSIFYVEVALPNGSTGQLLDIMDYISNSFMMPFISLLSAILIGWIMKPSWIAEEMELNGKKFKRKKLYNVMMRYIMPVIMVILFLQSTGVLNLIMK